MSIPRAKLPHRSKMRQSLFSCQPDHEGQDGAQQQTGRDREMEAEIAFGEVQISRQTSEPTPDKSGPNEQPDGRQGYSDYE